MSLDWLTLDRRLHNTVKAWRRAAIELRRLPQPPADRLPQAPADRLPQALVNPLAGAPLDAQSIAAIEKHDDPLAHALVAWLRTLASERDDWVERVSWATQWNERRPVPHRDELMSVRELRNSMLAARDSVTRAPHAQALVGCALPMSDARIAAVERRMERSGIAAWSRCADGDEALAPAAAARWLAATHDAAEPWQRRGWVDGFSAAIGVEVSRGWPARLTSRWLGDVFSGSGLTDGLRITPLALPQAWGASSFARALGQLGRATLAASRPATLPFVLHERPRSVRRHVRFGSFALLAAQPAFARRVLGLGKDRARDHCRGMAAAMLCALRLDALRLVVSAALAEGKDAAHSCFAERSGQLFGDAAPRQLLAVLPELHPADASAFIGALLAVEAHAALVADYDEDWFRNPRAAAHLRDRDSKPDEPRSLDLDGLERCIGTAIAGLAQAFS